METKKEATKAKPIKKETVKPEVPKKEAPKLNIYQKMLEATARINKVAKNLKVGVGQSQYKATGEADVLEAVKPVEAELGIYSYPVSREIIEANVFTTTNSYTDRDTGEIRTNEKNSMFMRLKTVYRFVNTDNPAEYIDITTYGDGVDPQDKAPGKAMTYSDKYALLKAYKIETGDDPDQNISGDMKKNAQTKAKKPINKPTAEQMKIVKELNIDLSKVAVYYKCSVDDLSTEQIGESIKMQQLALERQKNKKPEPPAETTPENNAEGAGDEK